MSKQAAQLTKVWLHKFDYGTFDSGMELRVDFSNDRHHAVMVNPPFSAKELNDALLLLARNIINDPHLID